MEKFNVFQIGKVINDGSSQAILLDKKMIAALEGLEANQMIKIIWWFDQGQRDSLIEVSPYKGGPEKIGVFATRSPNRPNSIGLTTALITYINKEEGEIGISFIDAFDGSPVLDIKPYIPSFDRVENPPLLPWCKDWPNSYEASAEFDWERVLEE